MEKHGGQINVKTEEIYHGEHGVMHGAHGGELGEIYHRVSRSSARSFTEKNKIKNSVFLREFLCVTPWLNIQYYQWKEKTAFSL